MEHRQGVEHRVRPTEVDPGGKLIDVREDVAVAQHHTLRRAFGTGGKQHHGGIVGLCLEPIVKEPRHVAGKQSTQLVDGADGGSQVFKVDDIGFLRQRGLRGFKLRPIDEATRSQDRFDFRRRQRRKHAVDAGREVEHGRNSTEGLKREERDRRALRIRQQDAHPFALVRQSGDLSTEHGAAEQETTVADGRSFDIFHHQRACAMDPGGVNQCVEQGLVRVAGFEDQIGHHVVQLDAGNLAAGPANDLRRHVEFPGRQHGDGDLGEKPDPHLALEPRERTVLGAVDADGDDGRVGLVGHQTGTFVDLHQRAGDSDAALGEDHAFTVFVADHLDQRFQRPGVAGIEGEDIHQRQQRLRPPCLGHVGVDGERGLAGQQRRDQQSVQERDMIDNDDGPTPGGGIVFHTAHLDPEEGTQDRGDDGLDHRLGQKLANVNGDEEVADGKDQKDVGDAVIHEQDGACDERAHDHEQGVEDVVAGDDPRAIGFVAFTLHDGIERHGKDAAADRNAQ